MSTPFLHPLALALVLAAAPSTPARAGNLSECRNVKDALSTLGNPDKEYEARSASGACLVQHHLDQPDVNRVVLSILRDPSEDTLLREDLIESFADANLRHKVRVEGKLAPALGKEEREAVDRALSGVGSLLAAASAVKTIEEVVPASRFEPDFFRALSDIALDDSSHVLLRATAVDALEKISVKVFNSGVYDEKSVRLVRETLHAMAAREDDASFFTNAGAAYNHLAVAGLPGYTRDTALSGGRMLSSVKSEKSANP
jgi:hypothetical protein